MPLASWINCVHAGGFYSLLVALRMVRCDFVMILLGDLSIIASYVVSGSAYIFHFHF